MNNLLPTKEELKPIVKPLNTFYECGFNVEFDNLPEEKKLQILCDIVKETVYPNPIPSPMIEIDECNGNSFTACEILNHYLKEIGCCKNSRIVLAGGRSFDIENSLYYHPILLVKGNDDIIYQADPSPFVGYKMGTVEPLRNLSYTEFEEINDEMRKYIQTIKEVLYTDKNNEFNQNKMNEYMEICIMATKYRSLKKYSIEALKVLVKYTNNMIIQRKIKEVIKSIELTFKEKIQQVNLLENQISLWKEELKDIRCTLKEPKHQLELSQWIIQEGKNIHPEYERQRLINGKTIKLSMINPRVLYELGYNTIFIKTSAFFLGCQDIIRRDFIEKYPHTGEYSVNLSKPTDQAGIKPMLFSHALGENCARALSGESRVLLIEADPADIRVHKKQLRSDICGSLWGKELIWYDGKPILWEPMITNIIHGSDHAPEAALHYLVGNPEHQNMTRFMYPNPKLIYKKGYK